MSTAHLAGERPWADILAQQSQTQTGFWSAHLIPVQWPRAADTGTAMVCLIWSLFLAACRKPDFGANVNTPLCNHRVDDLPRTLPLAYKVPICGQGHLNRDLSWRLSRRKSAHRACVKRPGWTYLDGVKPWGVPHRLELFVVDCIPPQSLKHQGG